LANNIDVVVLDSEKTEGPPPSIDEFEGGFNILIVGSDQCEDAASCKDRGKARLNDVNMLLHVSGDHQSAVAVSIPRDLVVPIPSCTKEDGSGSNAAMSAQAINVALSYGGLPCAVLTVEALTGLPIQFAGLITFNGVIQMSTAVGGVDVCVNGPIKDKYTGLDLPAAGTYNLQGQNALAFLRSRHGVGDGSDLGRISSQQVYLSSLVRTLKSAETLNDITKVYGMAVAATTNMQLSSGFAHVDTLVSVALALKNIPLEKVLFVQYPSTTGQPGVYQGKVAPIKGQATALFAKLLADEPFVLEAGNTGRGSELDPNAPVATATPVDPSATATPTATTPVAEAPVLAGVLGQSAADYTCSVAN
jgi:LCP family protein required for cell wall assembly